MRILFTIILVCFSSTSFACRLAPTTEEFVINKKNITTVIPQKPEFYVLSFSRGSKGNTSCRGLASLRLKNSVTTPTVQGYIFELTKGSFKSFKKGAITSRNEEKEIFSFPFFEREHRPVDITIKITAVSKSGKTSQPQLLKIKHDGQKLIFPSINKKPNTKCKRGTNLFSQQVACT